MSHSYKMHNRRSVPVGGCSVFLCLFVQSRPILLDKSIKAYTNRKIGVNVANANLKHFSF